MAAPGGGKELTADERQALEAKHTFRRIVELRDNPVRGNFNAAHLREINRRIFQDLPRLGFDDVTPGEYRSQVAVGKDWIKTRRLETVGFVSYVAYSSMDNKAQVKLDDALKRVSPAEWAALKTLAFTTAIGNLYVALDYIHPFRDGNSRTLREFTRQLAGEAGYCLDWKRYAMSPNGRDRLYIARDLSVNELALPHIRDEGAKRDVVMTMDIFEGNPNLPELLRDAVRPHRSTAVK